MSQITIASLEADIKKREQELAEVKEQLKKAKLESPDKQLAKELHSMLCTWNHTDGCGWFYEIRNNEDDWSGSAHGQYLMKARSLIGKCKEHNLTVEQAINIFNLVRGV